MTQYAIEQIIELPKPDVRRKYEDRTYSDLRFGEVLKDIDLLAGEIAKQYSGGVAVTAALSRLDLVAPVDNNKDLILKADLNHVGRSSMEVGVGLGVQRDIVIQ